MCIVEHALRSAAGEARLQRALMYTMSISTPTTYDMAGGLNQGRMFIEVSEENAVDEEDR